jgi:threonine 3-dehydrogenase
MSVMSAVVKKNAEQAEFVLRPLPQCGSDQVLIKVQSAALCGTDMHIFEWNAWAQSVGIELPYIMGHECCGDVVAVGEGVSGVKAGDKVVAETHIPCGYCYQCMNGEQHICANLKMFGIHMNGCFAQYAIIPAACARPIPDEISHDIGAVMEPLGTAVRAASEMQMAGANVMVIGCGPIGLFAVAVAACMGAAKIFASDISPARLEIARKMGATQTLNPLAQDVARVVLGNTGNFGVDAVIEASGNVDAFKGSFQYLRKGGRMALIGLPGKPIEIELGREIVFKEAKIIGIHGRKMFETWIQMENLLASGKLDVSPVITHTLPLNQWQRGVELAKNGQACKVIYHPWEE